MSLAEALTGIGAILAALGGIFLIIRELNRRERRSADKQIDSLARQVGLLRSDFLAYHGWAFDLAQRMMDQGLEVPPAPDMHPLTDEEPEPQVRRFLRRRKVMDE